MARKRKRRGRASATPPSSTGPQRPESGSPSGGGGGKRGHRGPPTWLQTHGRDLRFLLIFAVLMGLYYLATTTATLKEDFFPGYLKATTQASGVVLHAFGYDELEVQGTVLNWHGIWVSVARGCDAVAPTALFVSAVIASPAPVLSKLCAVLGGTVILMLVNLARIITLFLTRLHWRKAFDVMHLDIWQAIFIFLAIMLWAGWASWTTQRRRRRSDAQA